MGEWPAPSVLRQGSTEARAWCLTDRALLDKWGALKTEPCATDFGLPPNWILQRDDHHDLGFGAAEGAVPGREAMCRHRA